MGPDGIIASVNVGLLLFAAILGWFVQLPETKQEQQQQPNETNASKPVVMDATEPVKDEEIRSNAVLAQSQYQQQQKHHHLHQNHHHHQYAPYLQHPATVKQARDDDSYDC